MARRDTEEAVEGLLAVVGREVAAAANTVSEATGIWHVIQLLNQRANTGQSCNGAASTPGASLLLATWRVTALALFGRAAAEALDSCGLPSGRLAPSFGWWHQSGERILSGPLNC